MRALVGSVRWRPRSCGSAALPDKDPFVQAHRNCSCPHCSGYAGGHWIQQGRRYVSSRLDRASIMRIISPPVVHAAVIGRKAPDRARTANSDRYTGIVRLAITTGTWPPRPAVRPPPISRPATSPLPPAWESSPDLTSRLVVVSRVALVSTPWDPAAAQNGAHLQGVHHRIDWQTAPRSGAWGPRTHLDAEVSGLSEGPCGMKPGAYLGVP